MNPFGTFESTVATVIDLCRRYEQPRILDVGCGEGRHLIALAPMIRAGLGIDVSAHAVSVAARRAQTIGNLSFEVLSSERLLQSDIGQFAIVLFIGSLEHMADPQSALNAARSRLQPDGRIVVVAISPRAPHAIISRLALRQTRMPVVRHLGREGVFDIAARAGLQPEHVRPLYRGSRRSPLGDLSLYDRLGGPTCAIVLRDANMPQPL